MESSALAQFSQPSVGNQMQILEIILQILTLSIMFLFVITLVVVLWLCLRQVGKPEPSKSRIEEVQSENAWISLPVDPSASWVGAYFWSRAFPHRSVTWARRVFSHSR